MEKSWLNNRRRIPDRDNALSHHESQRYPVDPIPILKAVTLGYMPPGKEAFAEIILRYLQHQEARLTPHAYERTRGVVEGHLKSAFGTLPLAKIRSADVQQYATQRSAHVAPGSVVKELNVLKHLLSLAVEWELIPP